MAALEWTRCMDITNFKFCLLTSGESQAAATLRTSRRICSSLSSTSAILADSSAIPSSPPTDSSFTSRKRAERRPTRPSALLNSAVFLARRIS